MLVGNFFANAFEAQIKQDLIDEDGNPTPIKMLLEKVDLAFTAVFTAELLLNMYAHLWWEFVSNGWSIFDFFVIAVSLIVAVTTPLVLASITLAWATVAVPLLMVAATLAAVSIEPALIAVAISAAAPVRVPTGAALTFTVVLLSRLLRSPASTEEFPTVME